MVRKGEYLERAVVIASERGPMEGLYHRGAKRPGVLIAPMHPLKEGSMESPIVAELAWAVTRSGHPTLRFNYRGVGASPGRFDEGEGSVTDLLDAAEHLARCLVAPPPGDGDSFEGEGAAGGLASQGGAPHPTSPPNGARAGSAGAGPVQLDPRDVPLSIAAVGFGAGVATRALRSLRRVETLVLVMPDPSELAPWTAPRGIEVVAVIAEREDLGRRRALEEVVSSLPRGRLAVIPGADRAFVRGLVELGKVVQEAVSPPGLLDLD